MKSVIKGRYKANVGAAAGSGAETFSKSEPDTVCTLNREATKLAQHISVAVRCN